jgi:hypothetical protein
LLFNSGGGRAAATLQPQRSRSQVSTAARIEPDSTWSGGINEAEARAPRMGVSTAISGWYGTRRFNEVEAITPRGAKSWIWVYHFDGRPRRMTFGAYPAVRLADAHLKLAQARNCWSRVSTPAPQKCSSAGPIVSPKPSPN